MSAEICVYHENWSHHENWAKYHTKSLLFGFVSTCISACLHYKDMDFSTTLLTRLLLVAQTGPQMSSPALLSRLLLDFYGPSLPTSRVIYQNVR